jgi:putative membrane protein
VAAFQVFNDLFPEDLWERVMQTESALSALGLVLVGLLLSAGAWLLAIATTILTFAGFELRREGDRLQMSYGLLERRRSTIPAARIQAVTITEGILRQPFGLVAVRIESAGYGKSAPESGILMPLARRSEVGELLRRACPAYAVDPESLRLAGLPVRARQRYLTAEIAKAMVLCILILAAVIVVPRLGWTWSAAGLALIPLAALLGWLKFQDAGWAFDVDGRLVVRERRIERVISVTRRNRLQHRSVHQNGLQRRAALATFTASVASGGNGGTVTLRQLDAGIARELLEHLGPPARRAAQEPNLASGERRSAPAAP